VSTLLYELAASLWSEQSKAILRIAIHLEDDTDEESEGCLATTAGLTGHIAYSCTRALDHENWHVARTLDETVAAVWTDGPEPVGGTDEQR